MNVKKVVSLTLSISILSSMSAAFADEYSDYYKTPYLLQEKRLCFRAIMKLSEPYIESKIRNKDGVEIDLTDPNWQPSSESNTPLAMDSRGYYHDFGHYLSPETDEEGIPQLEEKDKRLLRGSPEILAVRPYDQITGTKNTKPGLCLLAHLQRNAGAFVPLENDDKNFRLEWPVTLQGVHPKLNDDNSRLDSDEEITLSYDVEYQRPACLAPGARCVGQSLVPASLKMVRTHRSSDAPTKKVKDGDTKDSWSAQCDNGLYRSARLRLRAVAANAKPTEGGDCLSIKKRFRVVKALCEPVIKNTNAREGTEIELDRLHSELVEDEGKISGLCSSSPASATPRDAKKSPPQGPEQAARPAK